MNKNTVKPSLTAKRRTDVVENHAYAAFARRVLRAYARRVAAGDVEALRDLIALANETETAIRTAVIGLREHHYSWAEIAARLGVTKQAAHQRWGGDAP